MAFKNIILTTFIFGTLNLFSQTNVAIDGAAISLILEQFKIEDSPGLAVGIVKGGEVVYERYLGYANLEHHIEVDKDTRFNIASTAKQYTARMILQLSLEGKLSLEDDIRKYLPALYPDVKEEIRIRHLINHTSGIRDYVFLFEMKNKPYWKEIGLDNDDVIDLLSKQEGLTSKPGSKYSYSNSGYTILAEIIERVSGESFNNYSDRKFLELGMKETSFVRRYMGVIPNRADSYADWGSGLWLSTPSVTKVNGDGFLYTTLSDQFIYEQLVQNASQNNDVLSMKSQKPIPNSEIKTYGFGLELGERLGRAAQFHSGSTYGYHSHTTRFPKENLSIVVMSNNGTIWSGDIADDIASHLLPELDRKINYSSQIDDVNKLTLAQIQGQYISPDGFLIRVDEEDGKLLWKNANNSPYEIISEDDIRFSVDYNSEIKIGFYKNELVRFYPSGKAMVYNRHLDTPATLLDLEGFVGKYHSNELDMGFELKLSSDLELKLTFSNRSNERTVDVLNKNELLASNFIMKIHRDCFDRVTHIFVTLNHRAQNNRFKKEPSMKYQPKIETENGSIQVSTIDSKNKDASNILLTENDSDGNEIWIKEFGGRSYDKASSIMATKDGYLIVGSTSSYGNGNYDVIIIKVDKKGKKQWQKTFGGLYNEYGYVAEETANGFLIKGTKQFCTSNSDVFNRSCTTNVWYVYVDADGNEISNKVLDEI